MLHFRIEKSHAWVPINFFYRVYIAILNCYLVGFLHPPPLQLAATDMLASLIIIIINKVLGRVDCFFLNAIILIAFDVNL